MPPKKKKEADTAPAYPLASAHDFFFGHPGVEHQCFQYLATERHHHAWLIEGLEGIGKATLAWRLARFLLAPPQDRLEGLAINKDSQAWHLTKAASHPDFLYLAPLADSKTQIIKVDAVRQVNKFFTRSPALSKYRIVLIDAVDNMNVNAASALLKLLEEPPPHSLLFLISHRGGSVMPTIRSRCQKLRLAPLNDDAVLEGLATFAPRLTEGERAIALQLSNGSLSKALAFSSPKGLEIYRSLQAITAELGSLDIAKINKFSTLVSDAESYNLFCRLMLDWSHTLATQTSAVGQGLELWDALNKIIQATERLNMDKKLATHKMFIALERIAA